jgi:dipeptidyl aminopeptidase/acylaminoacyl peptidase
VSRLTNIEDLLRFAAPSEPRLSPDGRYVAYVVKTVNEKKNRYETQLYVAETNPFSPPEPKVFTQGESVSNHRWAPDSQSLVFVRLHEKKSQIWQIARVGGEAIKISDLPQGSIGELAFSPDGSKLLFSFRPADEEFSESAVEARKKANQSTPPRLITRLRWRNEGAGWIPSAFFDLHTLTLATGEVTKLTAGDRDFGSYCWSPCGKFIAYTQNTAPNPDLQMGATALFVRELGGDTPREIGTLGPKGNLAWSPEGKHIAFLGHDHADEVWGTWNVHPWVVEVESGAARDLTPHWDVTAGDNALGEVYGRGDNGPLWDDDGESVVFVASDQGEVSVYKIGLDGGVPEKLTPEGCSEVGVSLAAGKTATLRLTSHDAGDIYVDGTRFSELNAALCAEVSFIEPKAFSVGEVPYFALIPEGDGPFPTILYIHGGPHLMYGRWHLFHEYQALAAAGFAVLYPNPRGSKGYGEVWTGAIRDNWGAPAMDDCMACVDDAVAQGWSDPSRLAVMGGSYGGYLTAWIVGHTDRFACAIAERGVYNLQSFGGTTDFLQTDHSYFLSNHTNDTESFRRNSPITYAGNVKTPLLVVHSEGDLRCPVSQGDEYFRAVKRTSPAEVSYLRFGPEASHELSRGGPPDLRIERQKRFHAWLKQYLQL